MHTVARAVATLAILSPAALAGTVSGPPVQQQALTIDCEGPVLGAFEGAATAVTADASAPTNLPAPPANAQEDRVALLRQGDGEINILFVRGADRSGGFLEANSDAERTEQLADINNQSTASGNHGWFELAETLRADGFTLEQITEPLEPNAPPTGQTSGAPVPFDQLDLTPYEVIVLGSNNAIYTQPQIDAIDQFVRAGGGVLFISDANFGSSWNDAPDSDQQFLDRYNWTMQQDRGTYILRRADGDFLRPDHPILAFVDAFDGEGVSPIVVPETDIFGVSTTPIARAKPGAQTRNNDGNPGSSRPVGPRDTALAIATVADGRIAGHLDRNTFFNRGGAGTNINRFDNRRYAVNLFRWLAGLPIDGPTSDCNDNGLDDTTETGAIPSGGLIGTYFDGLDFTGERRARIDPTVDFDYGSGAPFPDWDGDTFSTRWTGFVRTTTAGAYTFGTITNDGARLFVAGIQLVDEWMNMPATLHTGSITLPGDTLVAIRMEHYEGQNTAAARLVWASPGADPANPTIIPQSNLVPARDDDANGLPDDCDRCNGADLAAPFASLTFADVSAFLDAFARSDPAADIAPPQGSYTFADISVFLAAFSDGCP